MLPHPFQLALTFLTSITSSTQATIATGMHHPHRQKPTEATMVAVQATPTPTPAAIAKMRLVLGATLGAYHCRRLHAEKGAA
jgi:hypothetical protein